MRRRHLLAIGAVAIATVAVAAQRPPKAAAAATGGGAAAPAGGFRFRGITGSEIALDEWRGQPVLVVNTASRCGFTSQYEDMQALYDRFRARGLVVLAVPSDDFNQELGSDAEVAEFCEVNFGLDLPMAGITRVRGPEAHPFYLWLAREHRFAPRWNFNKVLIGPDGEMLGSWGSATRPTARAIVRAVEAALAG